MPRLSPFRLMNTVFLGLVISLTYSMLSFFIIYFLEGKTEALRFLEAYNVSFKALISTGLILGTALVVFRERNVIPQTIEEVFTGDQLIRSEYYFYKGRFVSGKRSMMFAAQFAVVAFIIFTYCQFPLDGWAEALMIIPACAQYALGVYVGRKLFYAGMMIHSLLEVTATRNLFKERELDEINSYVHIVSTLTVIFGYVHLVGYTNGPFLYQSAFGESVKIFLTIPALIATPVLLIFNFYPRFVLRKLYNQSIDIEVKKLQEVLQDEELNSFEKRSYLLEFDRMSREELRHNLQLTLSDLPIGVTIFVMLSELLLSK